MLKWVKRDDAKKERLRVEVPLDKVTVERLRLLSQHTGRSYRGILASVVEQHVDKEWQAYRQRFTDEEWTRFVGVPADGSK